MSNVSVNNKQYEYSTKNLKFKLLSKQISTANKTEKSVEKALKRIEWRPKKKWEKAALAESSQEGAT